MAISNSVLVDAGQEAANLFACSSTNGDALTTMYFCNRSAANLQINVYVVTSSFVANANNIVYSNVTITSGDTLVVDWEKLVFSTGDTIRANASAGDSIVATVSTIGL
jgi:hypothetical protein